jgi:Stress responsive A/B Barrel Domain
MLHHVVFIALKASSLDAEVDAMLEGFASLPGAISQIRSYDFGQDAGLSPNDVDVVLVATFDSVEDFAAYREHPAHMAFVRDLLEPICEERTSAQFLTPS